MKRRLLLFIAGLLFCGGAVFAADQNKILPSFDPAEYPFRRAPMPFAPRSISIPLGEDCHVAFDQKTLWMHTTWTGKGLALYGPVFSESKRPFICQPEGELLWESVPAPVWRLADGEKPMEVDFKAVRFLGGRPVVEYRIRHREGNWVEVMERPELMSRDEGKGVCRRVLVGPTSEPLVFSGRVSREVSRLPDEGGLERPSASRILVPPVLPWNDTENRWGYAKEFGVPGLQYQKRVIETPVRFPIFEEETSETGERMEIGSGEHFEDRVFVLPSPNATEFVLRLRSQTAELEIVDTPSLSFEPAKETLGDGLFASEIVKAASLSGAQTGNRHYRISQVPLPSGVDVLVGGLDFANDGSLVVASWTGEIYHRINGHQADDSIWRRVAHGLNEPLGLSVTDSGDLLVAQKGELTRLEDSNGNGYYDRQVCLTDDWGYTGNYHAYAFGPVETQDGRLNVFLTGQRGRWDVPYVGWVVSVRPDGSDFQGYCRGLRVANGFGLFGPEGDLFGSINQGNWVATCRVDHLKKDVFYGFPSGQPASEQEYRNPSEPPPPALWLPRELSPSVSQFAEVKDDRFGPFEGQMILGDFQRGVLMRACFEKVDGEWQGAAMDFLRGFRGAVNRLRFGPDGALYVGGCKRTWSTPAPDEGSLERVSFTGKTPFEISRVSALSDGFEIRFTEPLNRARAIDPENYVVAQFNYRYHQAYGSPEFDHSGKADSRTELSVSEVTVSEDGLSVFMTVPGLRAGYVTQIRPYAVTNQKRKRLLNDTAFYTLNRIPSAE